jgi:hypothetical protein
MSIVLIYICLDILWYSILDWITFCNIFIVIIYQGWALLNASLRSLSLNSLIWTLSVAWGWLLIHILASAHCLDVSSCIRIPKTIVSVCNFLTKFFLIFNLVSIPILGALIIRSFWILMKQRLSLSDQSSSTLLIYLIWLIAWHFFFLIFIIEYFHVNFFIHLYF